jgi:hypothetical protein
MLAVVEKTQAISRTEAGHIESVGYVPPCTFNNESLYDQYVGSLEHVTVKTSFLLIDVETERLGDKLLCSLFFTAAHYRDVAYRRTAVGYLRRCGWAGVRLVTIVEQMIDG